MLLYASFWRRKWPAKNSKRWGRNMDILSLLYDLLDDLKAAEKWGDVERATAKLEKIINKLD